MGGKQFQASFLFCAEGSVEGFGSPSQGVEERSHKQSSDLHEISQTFGHVRISSEFQT